MLIQGRSMFMTADSGTRTTPSFGNMPRIMASRSSRKTRTFRNGAFSWVSLQNSSGYAQPTAPPKKSRTSYGLPSRLSSASSRRTKNRAWSLESAQRHDIGRLLNALLPHKNSRAWYYRARYYDPQTGRFLNEDPMRFDAGVNFYRYTLNNPANFRDPDGMDIAVIENGPTEGNPIGHTAIAITGHGIYSFGNNTVCGSSLKKYLQREAPRRNTVIFIIKTTPAQDAAALADLQKNGSCQRTLPITFGNCSSISNSALTAAGIPAPPAFNPITGEPVFPSDFVPGSAGVRAGAAGASTVNIPKNSPTIPGGLQGFEPVQ